MMTTFILALAPLVIVTSIIFIGAFSIYMMIRNWLSNRSDDIAEQQPSIHRLQRSSEGPTGNEMACGCGKIVKTC